MAISYHFLLFRTSVTGPSVSPILHVSLSSPLAYLENIQFKAKITDVFISMRYSRLLEENSFSNRRADYAFLLFLCAAFLLVGLTFTSCVQSILKHTPDNFAPFDPAVPIILSCLCVGLHLVKAQSFDQNVPFWCHNVSQISLFDHMKAELMLEFQYHCPVPPSLSCGFLMVATRRSPSRSWRPRTFLWHSVERLRSTHWAPFGRLGYSRDTHMSFCRIIGRGRCGLLLEKARCRHLDLCACNFPILSH